MNTHVGRYTEWIKDYTFSSAIRKIERYEDNDMLEDEATDALIYLKNVQEQQLQ